GGAPRKKNSPLLSRVAPAGGREGHPSVAGLYLSSHLLPSPLPSRAAGQSPVGGDGASSPLGWRRLARAGVLWLVAACWAAGCGRTTKGGSEGSCVFHSHNCVWMWRGGLHRAPLGWPWWLDLVCPDLAPGSFGVAGLPSGRGGGPWVGLPSGDGCWHRLGFFRTSSWSAWVLVVVCTIHRRGCGTTVGV
uniref:Uncharacterized protein n=1 Tax=Triticum urartu TaxID=4572 RepID=A0A8R7R4Y1_TRIUA